MENGKQNGTVVKILVSIIGGGLLTLLFTTLSTVNVNSQRISKLEAIVEMQGNIVTDVAALKVIADRNAQAIGRIEGLLTEHTKVK